VQMNSVGMHRGRGCGKVRRAFMHRLTL
jgi:hypothetical protein